MKRIITFMLIMIISLCPLTVFAAEETDISKFEFPKPAAPVYMMYDAADRDAVEGNDALYIVRQTDMSVLELSAEYYSDSDAFLEKYGLYNFTIVMQYDTSLDGTDNWNYTPEWDEYYNAPDVYQATAIAWIDEEMMDTETIFDLYNCEPDSENYSNMEAAIIRRDVPDGEYTFNNYYFDHENHSLYVRCRYYMEWETYDGENIGELQSKYSEWSDVAIFGKDGTYVTPDEPTGYEAPIISDLAYEQPAENSEQGRLTYYLNTPESVWNAAIYYIMTGEGDFDTLETEICIDDGEWLPYETVNSWSDWGLSAGTRTAYQEEPVIEADTNVKLRVRYTGTHGESEWSNVIEMNDGGTQEVTEGTYGEPDNNPTVELPEDKDECSLCGFCPVPFGLCIFIWLVIILAIILVLIVLIVIIVLASKSKKCKNCGTKLEKNMKHCPKCGTARK